MEGCGTLTGKVFHCLSIFFIFLLMLGCDQWVISFLPWHHVQRLQRKPSEYSTVKVIQTDDVCPLSPILSDCWAFQGLHGDLKCSVKCRLKKKIPKDIFICHTKEFYNNVHINIKRSLLFVDNPGKMVW